MDNFADYSLNRGLRVKQRLFIGDSDDPIAAVVQPSFAFRILGCDCVPTMNSAINLDDEPRSMADEIDNVRPKWSLPTKARARLRDFAQFPP
jgi:hypothetical protein